MAPGRVPRERSGCEDLLEAEAGAVGHMNADHADAVELYARAFCAAAAGPWQLAGLDPEGLDLVRGDQMPRLWFETPLGTAEDLRPLLVRLAGQARAKLGPARPSEGQPPAPPTTPETPALTQPPT